MSSLGTSFINKSRGKAVGPKPPPLRRNKSAIPASLTKASPRDAPRPTPSPAPQPSAWLESSVVEPGARGLSKNHGVRLSKDRQVENAGPEQAVINGSSDSLRKRSRVTENGSLTRRREPHYGPWNKSALERVTSAEELGGDEARIHNTREHAPRSGEGLVASNPDSDARDHVEAAQRSDKRPRKVRSDKGVPRGPRSSSGANARLLESAANINPSVDESSGVDGSSQGRESLVAPNPPRKRTLRSRSNQKESTLNAELNGHCANAPPTDDSVPPRVEITAEDEPPPKKRRVARRPTPDDGDPDAQNSGSTMMFELTKDKRTGPVSQLEAAMRKIDWKAVRQQQLQAEEAAMHEWEARQASRNPDGLSDNEEEEEALADGEENGAESRNPRLRVVNGQIQFDSSSLTVDRHAETAAAAEDAATATVAFEESDLTNQTNTRSFLEQKRRDPRDRFIIKHKADPWTIEETSRFYHALRMFGTDFMIISKMFPGKTRRQVKNKFVREERENRELVDHALLNEATPMDIEFYASATGVDEARFKDPSELMEQLEREKEGQREKIERENKEKQEEQTKKRDAARQRQEQTKRDREERKRRKQERKDRQKSKSKKRKDDEEDNRVESVENNSLASSGGEHGNTAPGTHDASGQVEVEIEDGGGDNDAVNEDDLYDEDFSD